MKKTVVAIIILVIIILALFLIYIFGSGTEQTPDNNANLENPLFGPGQNVGGSGDSGGEAGTQGGGVSQEEGVVQIPRLRKIYSGEVSGYGLFDKSGTTTIRFIDRESGNIFETTSDSLDILRITNTTILRTINSFWYNQDNVVMIYIDNNDELRFFSAEILPKEEGREFSEVVGDFFVEDIYDISINEQGSGFILVKNDSGSIGAIISPGSVETKTVFSTPFQEITATQINKSSVLINTKPSAKSTGYAYTLNTSTGLLEKVIGGSFGFFSIMSPETKEVVYSKNLGTGISLWYYDGEESRQLSKQTLAEKCVWAEAPFIYCAVSKNSSGRDLPDLWYKGTVSFSDDIWKIDTQTNEATLLVSPESEVGESIDASQIKISDDQIILSFVNKIDGSLWAFLLEQKEN